jgi:glucokinase
VPRTRQEGDLAAWLQHDLGLERLSVERIVSGTGLGHVARWLLATQAAGGDHALAAVARAWQAGSRGDGADRPDLPAAVAAAAASGDGLARQALDLWLGAYGAAVGDLALTCLPSGGIWLAGGTAARLLEELRGPLFETGFLSKGRLRSALEPLPIRAALDPQLGTFSAAWRARGLLG